MIASHASQHSAAPRSAPFVLPAFIAGLSFGQLTSFLVFIEPAIGFVGSQDVSVREQREQNGRLLRSIWERKWTGALIVYTFSIHHPRRSAVISPEIASVTLHKRLPIQYHLYTTPFLCLYPIYAYAYLVKYDTWVRSEEWTFIYTVALITGHALSFLATRWSVGAKARITCLGVSQRSVLEWKSRWKGWMMG